MLAATNPRHRARGRPERTAASVAAEITREPARAHERRDDERQAGLP